MDTQRSEWINQGFIDTSNELADLARRQNALMDSLGGLWAEFRRGTSDPLTRKLCEKRLEELNQLIQADKPKLENSSDSGTAKSWD